MKTTRKLALLMVPVIGLAMTTSSLVAQNGNGAPSGAHYNLNIIGVENPKSSALTDSNRHTIFVGLGRTGQVTSKIYLTRGDFQVCGLESRVESFLGPYRSCVAAASHGLGELCAGDDECATGVCCGGRCADCCTADDRGCSDGSACAAVSFTRAR